MGCEEFYPPDEMCGAKHCGHYINTGIGKKICECIGKDGKKIPGCVPGNGNTPVATNECFNTKTKQKENITKVACDKKAKGDPNWIWQECICCCSCLAWYTKIATGENAVKFIQDFEVGDEVYVASLAGSGGQLQLNWEARAVDFSDGTTPSETGQEMILVQFGAFTNHEELTATNDQLFLMPDGKLMRADRLKPGDNLVRADGTLAPVVGVHVGLYTGGIHHISTPLDFEEEPINPDGHLLAANGIVVGDYALQLFQITEGAEQLLSKGHADRPVIGTEEYVRQSGVSATIFSATLKGKKSSPVKTHLFEPREAVEASGIPRGARRYFTPGQVKDIAKAPHVPVVSERNLYEFRYLQRLFASFYPNINIYLEWADETPNMYGFTQYGQHTVYVSGRLLRTNAIKREGLAVILSHGISLFLTSPSPDRPDYPCTGDADYTGLGYVLNTALIYEWSDVATSGYEQVKALFEFIKKKNRQGDPKNPCLRPSIDCRLECLSNALSGFELPTCAGAGEPGRLRLEGAEASLTEGVTSVVATFNEAVDFASSSEVTNYLIEPVADITTALRDEYPKSRVVLTVQFPDPPQDSYTLTVSDILSEDGSTLNPDARTASFIATSPPATKSKSKSKGRK